MSTVDRELYVGAVVSIDGVHGAGSVDPEMRPDAITARIADHANDPADLDQYWR